MPDCCQTIVPAPVTPERAFAQAEAVRLVLRRYIASDALHLERLRVGSDGAMVIGGLALDLATKKRALRLANFTSGACEIVDRLHVRPQAKANDGEIRAELLVRMALDARFNDIGLCEVGDPGPQDPKTSPVACAPSDALGRLSVEVVDGVVILDGAMPSLARKRLAGALAWRGRGVRDVINGLAVEPPEEDGPDQIEAAVRDALDGHPLLDEAEIRVGVCADVVRLTGRAPSQAARQAAEDEVWRIQGVDEVINKISAPD